MCQQMTKKMVEMFKNDEPQRKIGSSLHVSFSKVHNIIEIFKELGMFKYVNLY